MGFIAALKRLEARLDAWAATKLGPEEYAEAVVLDQRLKKNFLRWLAWFALAVVAGALILLALWPGLHPGRALAFSGAGGIYLVMAWISAWYGWRKYTRRPAWMVFALFMGLLIGGAIVGFVGAHLFSGRSLAEVSPEKFARAIGVALVLGIVLAGILVGIAQMRLREAQQKAKLLEADAHREKLERQGAQAELKLLQAQIEPHFLFNTLANLRYLVQTGSPEALRMLDHLIHYLRTALPEMRAEGSTVAREAELARAYLEIMRLRMGGALAFDIEVSAEAADCALPPLMLVTLVENAIKHGVGPLGGGRIVLRARRLDGRLRVEVEDDGRGLDGTMGAGVGLANIRERLRTLHGDAARLEIVGREPRGALAAIEVPVA